MAREDVSCRRVKIPEQFEQLIGKETMSEVVPSAAIALREAGNSAISLELLQRAEANARDLDRTNPADQVTLARIYAAQGRNNEAIALLSSAVRAGWLPPYLPIDVDLEHDPPFAELRGDTRFQRLRRQVLATWRESAPNLAQSHWREDHRSHIELEGIGATSHRFHQLKTA